MNEGDSSRVRQADRIRGLWRGIRRCVFWLAVTFAIVWFFYFELELFIRGFALDKATDPVDIARESGRAAVVSSATELLLTAALIRITWVYTRDNRQMLEEMRIGRISDRADRNRDRAENAANRAIDLLAPVERELFYGPGAGWLTPERCRDLAVTLDDILWQISDAELRERLAVTRHIGFSLMERAPSNEALLQRDIATRLYGAVIQREADPV